MPDTPLRDLGWSTGWTSAPVDNTTGRPTLEVHCKRVLILNAEDDSVLYDGPLPLPAPMVMPDKYLLFIPTESPQ
jgi:hypothetical protein